MIKFTVKTKKFADFLGAAMLVDGNPSIENILVEFTPTMMLFRDMTLDIVGVYMVASPSFFSQYDVPAPVKVPLTYSLYKQLANQFKSEIISCEISDTQIAVFGNNEDYKEDIINLVKGDFITEIVDSDIGFIPKNAMDRQSAIVKIAISDLRGLPKISDEDGYPFIVADGKVRTEFKDFGVYGRDLVLKESKKLEPISVKLNPSYVNRLVKNIDEKGDIWFLIGEKAVVFTYKSNDFAVMYMLVTQES